MVDADGRQFKKIEVGETAAQYAVEEMLSVAPVDGVWIGGNHDMFSSYMTARNLKAHFRNEKHFTMDVSPSTRKYKRFGKTCFGYAHGEHISDAQVRDLPTVMNQECPKEMLAQCDYHEWILAHRHRETKFTVKDTETKLGTVIRWIHSLSATDAWHHENTFIGNRRAAEVYLYDEDTGYCGHYLANARAN